MTIPAVTILAYHRINRPGIGDLSPDLTGAYPEDSEAQMRFIAAHYNVISSHDLVRALPGRFRLRITAAGHVYPRLKSFALRHHTPGMSHF